MNKKYTKIFERDLKNLSKKFKTLQQDINNLFDSCIKPFHTSQYNNQGITKLKEENDIIIYKVTKIASMSIKGKGIKTGLRIIYSYNLKRQEIEFIELYHKNQKTREDKERIKAYLKNNKNI